MTDATDNVVILPVVTTLDVPVSRVIKGVPVDELERVMVIGAKHDGELYFAASYSDGGDALWDMEIAKRALMEVSGK
jgi:hypothetical protein